MLVIIIAWIFADIVGIAVGLEAIKYHGPLVGSLIITASVSRLTAIVFMYCKEKGTIAAIESNVIEITPQCARREHL
jgi:hypothetical protein